MNDIKTTETVMKWSFSVLVILLTIAIAVALGVATGAKVDHVTIVPPMRF